MTTESTDKKNTALSYEPIDAHQAVQDDDYLYRAFENVMKWEESDKELAQGRTNFQLEKFALLILIHFQLLLKTVLSQEDRWQKDICINSLR